MRARLHLEAFESRIVPAGVVKYTEVDGDVVTVKASKGTTADLEDVLGFQSGATDVDGVYLDFTTTPERAAIYRGTNLKFTAGGAGNRLADDVDIDGFDDSDPNSIDFGVISIKGILNYIDAGDADLDTLAIKKITVVKWGPSGNGAAAPSEICGNIGSIVVKGDFDGYLQSNDFDGNLNFDSFDGTRIGSFKTTNIADSDGEDCGHIEVQHIHKLVVTGYFSGNADPDDRNGFIQAGRILKMNIAEMTGFARIELG